MEYLNKENFDEKVSKGTTIVDFFAEWCGPCKMLGPVFEKLSTEFENVNFAKVDVDSEGSLAQRYNVMGVPTMIIFRDGKEIERIGGFLPEDVLRQKIEQYN